MKTYRIINLLAAAMLCCIGLSGCDELRADKSPNVHIAGYRVDVSSTAEAPKGYETYQSLYYLEDGYPRTNFIVSDWTDKGPQGIIQSGKKGASNLLAGIIWDFDGYGETATPKTFTISNNGTNFSFYYPYYTSEYGWKILSVDSQKMMLVSDSRKWYACMVKYDWVEAKDEK